MGRATAQDRKRWLTLQAGVGVVVALVFLFPLLKPATYFLSLGYSIFMWVALTQSWNIIGRTGYLSFGHGAFFGIGAYTTALFLKYFNLSPFLLAPLAGVLATIVGFVVGSVCLRLRGPYFILVTLLFAFIVQSVVANTDFLGSGLGFALKPMPVSIEVNRVIFYEVMLVLAFLCGLVAMAIERSKLGFGLLCIREDEDTAETMGINASGLKLLAFSLSAFFTGMVGGVHSYYVSYISPDTVFSIYNVLTVVLMAVFGGTRTWTGPLLGAVTLSLMNEGLSILVNPEIARIMFGTLFIVVVLIMPNGIVEYVQMLFSRRRKTFFRI